MNFDAEITRAERIAADMDLSADDVVRRSAAVLLRERVYRTERGVVRVRADWSGANHEEPSGRVPLEVIDERSEPEYRDWPAFLELYFHEVYLMMNIAAPGCFGGVFAPVGGRFRIREIPLDPKIFDYARAAGAKAKLPLENVIAWYDSLDVGLRQIAETPAAKVLFHLLHIAHGESDMMIVVRLAECCDLLGVQSAGIRELRDGIVNWTVPIIHPMDDDFLDERVEDVSSEWPFTLDRAAVAVVTAIQDGIR